MRIQNKHSYQISPVRIRVPHLVAQSINNLPTWALFQSSFYYNVQMERVALFQVSGHFWRASVTHTHYSNGYRIGNLRTRWEWVDPGICFLCWQWMSWRFDFSLRAGNHLQTVLKLPGITSSSVIWICVFLRDYASSGQCRLEEQLYFLSKLCPSGLWKVISKPLHMTFQFPALLVE